MANNRDSVPKQPDYELVRNFLYKDDPSYLPEEYDFKLNEKQWAEYPEPLVRVLHYKKAPERDKIDPDSSDLNMSIQCILLSVNGFDVKYYKGRDIYLASGETLETDTINSFLTTYKGALKENISNYDQICSQLEIDKKGFGQVLDKVLENLDKFQLNGDLTEEINRFAILTHSIGNFNVGPLYFSGDGRYSKAQKGTAKDKKENGRAWRWYDSLDDFLNHKVGNVPLWEKWFSENIFSTYIDGYFQKIVLKENGGIDLKESILLDLNNESGDNGNGKVYGKISLTNKLIIERGKKMVDVLKKVIPPN